MLHRIQYIGLLLAPLVLFCIPASADAATVTWDNGGGDNLWSTAANWSPNGVPGSTGSVVFNTTSTANVTINTNVRVHSLTINSGYTGTITQSGAVMVGTGGFIQGGGTFSGGSAPILIHRHLTLTGGTLLSTSGILSISGSLIRSGGTFTHNSGTISLAAPGDRILTATSTFHRMDIESTKETGLVGYWKLDETSIPTANCTSTASGGCSVGANGANGQYATALDSSGYGWHASGPSSVWASSEFWPTHSSDGAPTGFPNPGSMQFYNSRSWVQNTLGPYVGTSGTVAFWVKNSDIASLQVLLSNRTTGSGAFLVVVNQLGEWLITGDQCTMPNRSAAFLSDGDWHHIAFAKSATDSTCSIYVDGALETTVFASPAVPIGKGIMIANHSGFDLLGILGRMDDVRLYSRALSSTEIAALASGVYPTRTGGSTLTASTTITASTLNVWNGTLAMGGNALTAEGSFVNYGTLSLGGGTFTFDSSISASSPVSAGDALSITVTDPNRNLVGTTQETVTVTIDYETVTLTETTASSGVFAGSIPTAHATDTAGDNQISRTDSCGYTVTALYGDEGSDRVTATAIINDADAPCEINDGGGDRGSTPRTPSTTPSPTPSSTPTSPPSETSSAFSDVPPSSWFATAVRTLVGHGIISGYKDPNGNLTGFFGPADPVTVGQILKIALLSAGNTLPSSLPLAKNSTATDWSGPYVAFAETLNIDLASETSQRSATRAEVIHTLLQTFNISSSSTPNPFSDLPATHPYASDILTATSLGLVTGDDPSTSSGQAPTVRPDAPINRAEIAVLVIRFMEMGE